MNVLPSGSKAIPSSSVGPDVTCSTFPLGNGCRQMWNAPPEFEVRYIHLPSGDQAAFVQTPSSGPIGTPAELPSKGSRRQRFQRLPVISTPITHLRSGDR